MTITAVGFDLDDTLIYTDRSRERILAATAADHGLDGLSREAYLDAHRAEAVAETRAPIFERLVGDQSVEPERVAATYRDRVGANLVAVPGCEDLLRGLAASYPLGLLTNGPERAQRAKLARFAWTDAFDAILVEGELGYGKPDERAFRALFDALDNEPGETAFVGDSVAMDVRGAADAGAIPIQVTAPDGPEPDDAAAAHVPRDRLAAELPALLDTL